MAGKGFIYLPVYSNDCLVNFCPHSSHDTFYRIKTDLRSAQGPYLAARKSWDLSATNNTKLKVCFHHLLPPDIELTSVWTFMKKRQTNLKMLESRKQKHHQEPMATF